MIAPSYAGRTRHWITWGIVLIAVTVALVSLRAGTAQTYVPLTYLLVVLGGSASGGRRLGFALAIASFLLIDYYLQTPYHNISIAKSVDLVTLAAFLVTAIVASELRDTAKALVESGAWCGVKAMIPERV